MYAKIFDVSRHEREKIINEVLENMGLSDVTSWALLRIEELLSLPIDELIIRLNTSLSGLSSDEAEKRLRIFGYNELAKRRKRAAIVEFLSHFRSPLVIILLIAGLISGFFGEIINALIIFSIVTVSVLLDFYQESKAIGSTVLIPKWVQVRDMREPEMF